MEMLVGGRMMIQRESARPVVSEASETVLRTLVDASCGREGEGGGPRPETGSSSLCFSSSSSSSSSRALSAVIKRQQGCLVVDVRLSNPRRVIAIGSAGGTGRIQGFEIVGWVWASHLTCFGPAVGCGHLLCMLGRAAKTAKRVRVQGRQMAGTYIGRAEMTAPTEYRIKHYTGWPMTSIEQPPYVMLQCMRRAGIGYQGAVETRKDFEMAATVSLT